MAAEQTPRRTRAAKKRAARERAGSLDKDDRQPSAGDEEAAASGGRAGYTEHAPAASSGAQDDERQQLARRVLSGAFLAQAGKNASELARRLKQAWTLLRRLPNLQQQEEDADSDSVVDADALRLLCAELLHERVLAADEKVVRSLAACSFAELLRVHAPVSPFHSSEELYDAFQLILEQIRGLAADAGSDSDATATTCDAHCYHVLESLAGAKSCVVLVGEDFRVEEGEETLLVQLFKTLFETIRSEHSAKIEALMVAIMGGCIEELDLVDQPLLDAMLAPLVQQTSAADSRGDATGGSVRGPYHLAQELIRRTGEQLQSQLSHFFNSILVDAPSALTAHTTSTLKEHVYALIYEVHKTSPSLLLYVLPNVCLQLQVDEVATRSEAIALMGRLFASSHADYGHQYMKNFRDFLGRFRDVSKEIRLQMIQVCAIIWQRKAELGGMIEKEFIQRLSDPDWEVRRLVVNEVCDLAASSLELVSEECLRQVGERMKDKKVILRKETMTGLSQVYAAHISGRWSLSDADEEHSLSVHHVPSTHAKKLGWVPDFVLKCFAYPQQELRLRVVQLLDDILLPKASSDAIRAKGLLYIFHSVDQTSKEALRRILSERAKCVQVCREFVAAKKRHRQLLRSRPEATNSDLSDTTEKLFAGLSPLFPEVANLRKLLEQLCVWKDQSVFKHMEHLCDYSKSLGDIRSARDQLVKCVGSKSPLGEFMKTLCRKLNLLTVNRSSISTYLSFFVENGVQHAKENRDIIGLMLMVSKIMPAIFSPFIKDEIEAILLTDDDAAAKKDEDDDENDDESEDTRDHRVIEGMLGVLANYSEHWKALLDRGATIDSERSADDSAPSKLLLKQLEKYCWNPSIRDDSSRSSAAMSATEVHMAKLAALSIANFCGTSKDTSLLIQKLCAKKRLSSPSSPGAAATLQSLLVFTKRCGDDMATNASLVASLWSTLREHFLSNDADQSNVQSKNRKRVLTQTKLVDIRCLAIRVLVNVVLYCRLESEVNKFIECSQQVLELLFDLLRSDGRKWTSNAGLAIKYRVVAASSLLKLMRHASVERLVTVAQWHMLGFVMQDSSEEVRSVFLQKLTSHLMKYATPHPHKYVSYLVLAASEPNSVLKKKARNLLGVAVQRMRRMFEASLARGRSDGGSSTEVRALMVPEYALPYVLHLLAHHPDFPKEAAQRSVSLHAPLFHNPVWSSQLLHLNFFLDGLVPSTASAEADNIAFLLQMLAKLSECDDVTDPSSTNIYPLVDSAALLVKKKIKNQSSLRPFPGKIYLPKQLFVAGRGKGSALSAAAPGTNARFGAARSSNDSVGSRGPRIMTSLSPIKGSDIRDHFMQLKTPPVSAKKRRSIAGGTPDSSRKATKKNVASTPTRPDAADGNSEPETITPPRRQSLMRQARLNPLSFTEEASDVEDDLDDLLPGASVAARSSTTATTATSE